MFGRTEVQAFTRTMIGPAANLLETGNDRRGVIYDIGFILVVLGTGRHAIVFD